MICSVCQLEKCKCEMINGICASCRQQQAIRLQSQKSSEQQARVQAATDEILKKYINKSSLR